MRSLFARCRRRRVTRSVWLPKRLLTDMRTNAVGYLPDETGGMLLGYTRASRRHLDFVVTGLVAAGPNAQHKPNRFVPDGDWQQAKLERAYCDSHQVTSYLGDWHSHPGGRPRPSGIDRRTSARVAASRPARAPIPLCLILGPRAGWFDARAYTFERRRFHVAELLVTDER